LILCKAVFDRQVLAFDKLGLLQAPAEGCHHLCGIRIVGRPTVEEPDHRHRRLLRARRERPCGRAREERDEDSPFHSITSSARASSVGGTVRPSALAALRLIANSKLVGACTGRSAGRVPLRIRSMYSAARGNVSPKSTP